MGDVVESSQNSLDDFTPELKSKDFSALGDQGLEDEHPLAALVLSHGLALVLGLGDGSDAHLDDGLDGRKGVLQDVAPVEDEELDSMEGLPETAVVLPVEDLGNDFEHLLLVLSDPLPLVHERSTIKHSLRNQQQDVFFEVQVSHPVNEGHEGQHDLFNVGDELRNKIRVLPYLPNHIPALVEQQLGRRCLLHLLLDVPRYYLQALESRLRTLLEEVRIVPK